MKIFSSHRTVRHHRHHHRHVTIDFQRVRSSKIKGDVPTAQLLCLQLHILTPSNVQIFLFFVLLVFECVFFLILPVKHTLK